MAEDTKPVAGDDEQGIVEEESASRMSLTRGKALGVGAVALGGAAISGLAGASRAQGATMAVSGTTSLTALSAAGSHVLAVKSTVGFAVGYTVWIDAGANGESGVVSGVNATTMKLTVNGGLQHAHPAGTRVSVIPPSTASPSTFKNVLTKLANDPTYRSQAIQNPNLITQDNPSITLFELHALRDCAILSGADIHAINSARAAVITGSAGGDPGRLTITIGGITGSIGWSVSCCSCCCCCCGETAVLTR